MAEAPMLEAGHIVAGYDGVAVLHDVSLSIAQGETDETSDELHEATETIEAFLPEVAETSDAPVKKSKRRRRKKKTTESSAAELVEPAAIPSQTLELAPVELSEAETADSSVVKKKRRRRRSSPKKKNAELQSDELDAPEQSD